MRQVPRYAVIGNGRMAKHICHYFDELKLPYQNWNRANHSPKKLAEILALSTHVLLLISDGSIADFIQQHHLITPEYTHLKIIHFSGALSVPGVYSTHPLQTFAVEFYSLPEYEAIPFIMEESDETFEKLLPGLKNPHYAIKSTDKAYYHAMCVMANNFSTILWQKFFKEMSSRFYINEKDLLPFLNQSFRNLAKNPDTALTGPIPRKDSVTLKRNLSALEKDDFYFIFRAFVEKFFPEIKK